MRKDVLVGKRLLDYPVQAQFWLDREPLAYTTRFEKQGEWSRSFPHVSKRIAASKHGEGNGLSICAHGTDVLYMY